MGKINYKKRPSGMSKREYAAQQMGGTLNYKTGKISVPVKVPKASSVKATPKPTPSGGFASTTEKDGVYNGYYVVNGVRYHSTGSGFIDLLNQQKQTGDA